MPEPSGVIWGEQAWALTDLPAAHVFDAKTLECIEFVSYVDLVKGVIGRPRLDNHGKVMCYDGAAVMIFETRPVLIEFVEDPPAPLKRTMWTPLEPWP